MSLINIFENTENSYKPLVDFEHWRVAVMNDMEKYTPENIEFFQKHNESDESFALLKGNCTLYVAEGIEKPEKIFAYKMEPLKVYNVKKGVWHTHAFAPDTSVIIIENSDTNDSNSPKYYDISEKIRTFLIDNAGF